MTSGTRKIPGMQARHHDRGSARIARPAPFAPKLDRDEERIEPGRSERRGSGPLAVVQRSWNLTDAQPESGADEGCRTAALRLP